MEKIALKRVIWLRGHSEPQSSPKWSDLGNKRPGLLPHLPVLPLSEPR